MENHKLVLPAHLNHYGYLFGGDLLKWVDEYAWIAASLEYPGINFVTIAMDKVEFRRSVQVGTILKFVVDRMRVGKTSVQYNVKVFRGEIDEGNRIFSTNVTFVSINEHGRKVNLPK